MVQITKLRQQYTQLLNSVVAVESSSSHNHIVVAFLLSAPEEGLEGLFRAEKLVAVPVAGVWHLSAEGRHLSS